MARHRNRIALGILLLATLHVAVEIARAPSWTVDDAWITARYASNFVRHGVFAFNVEGPHVEGITSLLYGIFATIFVRLGISPIRGLNAISSGALLVSGILVFRIAQGLRVRPHLAAVLGWIWLAIPEHVTHATSGLETEAFVALSFACIEGFLRTWHRPQDKVLPIACVLICFCRPEGFAIVGVLYLILAYRHRRHLGRLRRSGAIVTAAIVSLTAFRLIYFESLLPNTFYAKSRGRASAEVLLDLVHLEANVIDFVVVAMAVAVVGFLLAQKQWRARKVGPRALSLIVASVLLLAVFLATYRHKDVMNYSRRFAMHALPWLFTVAIIFFALVTRILRRLSLPRGRLAAIVGVGLLFGLFFWLPARMHTHAEEIQKMTDHAFVRRHWYEPAAQVIRTAAPHAKSLAVVPDAGFLPYETDIPTTIDFGRLNDRYLAREAQSSSDVVEYFFRMHPDVVVFSHYGEERLFNADAKQVMTDSRFTNEYQRVAEFRDARAHGISVYIALR